MAENRNSTWAIWTRAVAALDSSRASDSDEQTFSKRRDGAAYASSPKTASISRALWSTRTTSIPCSIGS
jgi:hypothetical protein